MLYLVASNAGLRCQELGSLTKESFSLDGAEPSLEIEAAYSKHRRKDTLPLREDLAKLLPEYLSTKEAGKPIWPGRWVIKAAKMMRGDLAAARAAWINERLTRRNGRSGSRATSWPTRTQTETCSTFTPSAAK